MTRVVTFDLEVVEASLPVSRLTLLPVGYMGLDLDPGDVDVFAQLYSALVG